MLDLKFFYIVELNLQHKATYRLPLASEFVGQDWLTMTSEAFTSDVECIQACKKLMTDKQKFFNKDQRVKLSYAENPALSCPVDKLDDLDLGDFDANSLVEMTIVDADDKWVMRSSVQVFGINAPSEARRLH
jgi:hypothetical protein